MNLQGDENGQEKLRGIEMLHCLTEESDLEELHLARESVVITKRH